LKESGLDEDKVKGIFRMIAAAHLKEDENYYEEAEVEVEKVEKNVPDKVEVVEKVEKIEEKPLAVIEPKRYINVIQTQEDRDNMIKKYAEARILGKTRLDIKIV